MSQSVECILVLTYHIPLLTVIHRLVSELLDGDKNAYSITDLLDAHLLENFLVALDKVIAVEIICCAASV